MIILNFTFWVFIDQENTSSGWPPFRMQPLIRNSAIGLYYSVCSSIVFLDPENAHLNSKFMFLSYSQQIGLQLRVDLNPITHLMILATILFSRTTAKIKLFIHDFLFSK